MGIVVLVVEGYYVYRFYEDSAAVAPGTTVSLTGEAEYQTSDNSSAIAAAPRELKFVHRATSENIFDNGTYLDDPLANGNPDAFLSATQNWNPGGGPGTYNDHAIGVWYDPSAQRWAIFNQDDQYIPDGAAFNVVISGDSAEVR